MNNNIKRIICIAAAVAIVGGGATGGILLAKSDKDKESEITTAATTTTEPVTETDGGDADTSVLPDDGTTKPTKPEVPTAGPGEKVPLLSFDKLKVDYSGVAYGLYTQNGIDFYGDETGFYAVTPDKIIQISKQNCGPYFYISDNKIYYTVIGKTTHYNEGETELKEFSFNWTESSGWVMNLDGSNQHKIIDFFGTGFLLHEDEENIYYADEPGYSIAMSYNGHALFKYNKKTHEKTCISDHTDGENPLAGFKYADGKIIYTSTAFSPDCFYIYNTENGKITKSSFEIFPELNDDCGRSINVSADGKYLYLIKIIPGTEDDGTCKDENILVKYNIESGETKELYNFGYYNGTGDVNIKCVDKNNNVAVSISNNMFENDLVDGIYIYNEKSGIMKTSEENLMTGDTVVNDGGIRNGYNISLAVDFHDVSENCLQSFVLDDEEAE